MSVPPDFSEFLKVACQTPWLFTREVSNATRMTGTARFHTAAPYVQYREEGMLYAADTEASPIWKNYLFAPTATGFDVYFDENPPRLFHAIKLEMKQQGWTGEGLHLCRRDTYRSTYVFAHDLTRFSIAHKIDGPAKDYAMETFYSLANG